LRLAIQAEILAMKKAKGATQSSIAKDVKMTQPMVGKAMNRAELGQDFARVFLRTYRLDAERLIAKHGTRTTAGDLVRRLRDLPALEETVLANSGRWTAEALVRLIFSLKRDPTLARPDGLPTRGSWEEMLDEVAEGRLPATVGGLVEFREQLPKPRGTPKGG
jgi:hypothetical protein